MVNFIHPAKGSRVTSPFGWRESPTQKGVYEGHQGIDYAKSGNVPIVASADGIVRQYTSDNTTYGNVVFIEHNIKGKRMDTTYAHLKSKTVVNGQTVKQGDIIGYMGSTGRSTGQHLHFEIHNGPWKPNQPNSVNPALYVDKEDEEEMAIKELKKKVDALEITIKEMEKAQKEKDNINPHALPAEWSEKAIDFLVANNIIQGTTNGMQLKRNITREEAFKLVFEAIKYIEKGGK